MSMSGSGTRWHMLAEWFISSNNDMPDYGIIAGIRGWCAFGQRSEVANDRRENESEKEL